MVDIDTVCLLFGWRQKQKEKITATSTPSELPIHAPTSEPRDEEEEGVVVA